MFTVFQSPTLTQRKNVNQSENNVAARKPAVSSRKPLADRKPNLEPPKPQAAKPKAAFKPKTNRAEPEIDVCSYKHVKDVYNDLIVESERLGEKGARNVLRGFTYDHLPPTPKFERKYVGPVVTEVDFTYIDDISADEITQVLYHDYKGLERPELYDLY